MRTPGSLKPSPDRPVADAQRRLTDPFWALLFTVAVSLQVLFALRALSSWEWSKSSPLPLLLPPPDQHPPDHHCPQRHCHHPNFKEELVEAHRFPGGHFPWSLCLPSLPTAQAAALAIAVCGLAGVLFVILLAALPVTYVIWSVAVCGPTLLLVIGGLELSGVNHHVLKGLVGSTGGLPFVVAGLMLLLGIYVSWRQLRLGIAVLECTSAFLRARPIVGLCPLVFGAVHLAGQLLWALAAAGAGELFMETRGLDWQVHVATVLGFLLCFLWGSACVTAWSTFTVSYMAAHWYTRTPQGFDAGGLGQLVQAAKVGLTRHAGSMALGSLLIACVRLLNIVLCWAGRKDRHGQVTPPYLGAATLGGALQPQPPSFARSCRNFAAEILEVAATWASRQALVQVAIHGCSFSKGALDAANLAYKAPAGFAAVEALSSTFHRVCELLLIGIAVLIASLAGFDGVYGLAPPTFFAWLVAESLLHPYTVATSTILQCCLYDNLKDPGNPNTQVAALRLRDLLESWDDKRADTMSWAQNYQH